MEELQPTDIEFMHGPETMLEYLYRMAQRQQTKVESYQGRLEENKSASKSSRIGLQKALEREEGKYARIYEAQVQACFGNEDPGLEILREHIKDLKATIAYNVEYKKLELSRRLNKELIVLQMLGADITGKEPAYYGTKALTGEKEEEYQLPETVTSSDLVAVSLFKTAYSLERAEERKSGMMYRPSSEKIGLAVDRLFDYDNGLTNEEKELLKRHVTSIYDQIKNFGSEKFKVRYDTSYPQSLHQEMNPQEVMRLRKPFKGSPVPNVLVYLEGGQLKCRLSVEEERAEQVFDLSESSEGIREDSIAEIKPLPEELEDKIVALLRSEGFKKQWAELTENRELTTVYI